MFIVSVVVAIVVMYSGVFWLCTDASKTWWQWATGKAAEGSKKGGRSVDITFHPSFSNHSPNGGLDKITRQTLPRLDVNIDGLVLVGGTAEVETDQEPTEWEAPLLHPHLVMSVRRIGVAQSLTILTCQRTEPGISCAH